MPEKHAFAHQMIRAIFTQYGDIEEWRLGDAARAASKGYPRLYDGAAIDDYGIVFVDIAVEDATGSLICFEVNGPNGIGSDALTGNSFARAENESSQTLQRLRDFGLLQSDGRPAASVVTLHAHTNWNLSRSLGEVYPRVLAYADILREKLSTPAMKLRAAEEELGGEKVSVVSGEVRAVAKKLRVDSATKRFTYEDRPVVFAGNPNLLPELVRTKKLGRDGSDYLHADLRVFHAWRLASLIHNRSLQQELFGSTGIKPIPCVEAKNADDALATIKQMLSGGAVVLKPNGCSGGTGVHVATPEMNDDEIRARIEALLRDCEDKYGENAETQIMPIRCFPFARTTLYPMDDGGHAWDLRIAVMFEPGRLYAYPVSMRIAPIAFDPRRFHRERGQWVTNVSGKRTSDAPRTAGLISGMDDGALRAVGLTEAKMEEALTAAVAWTIKSWLAAKVTPLSAEFSSPAGARR